MKIVSVLMGCGPYHSSLIGFRGLSSF